MHRIRSVYLAFALLAGPVYAGTLAVSTIPHRYTVVRGDTLWGIANHFFKDPWRWPGIWNHNQQVRNPDLIYPGDVLTLRYINGKPRIVDLGPGAVLASGSSGGAVGGAPSLKTIVLRPSVESQPVASAIPTLDPSVIGPFVRWPMVFTRKDLRHLGYVAGSVHRHTFMGTFSRFYARRLGPHPAPFYDIYREGRALYANGHFLGYEGIYVGRAIVVHKGRTAELEIRSSDREVELKDWLVPGHVHPLVPYYYPRAPRAPLRGIIVGADHGHAEFGTYAVFAVDIGKATGVRRGYVLRVYAPARRMVDPVTGGSFKAPQRPIGLLMIFRIFPKVSYGVLMQAHDVVKVGDSVGAP